MEILLAVQLMVLGLVAILLVGLLRSHAESLRRLTLLEGGITRKPRELPHRASSDKTAADIAGGTPFGNAAQYSVSQTQEPVLLAFLSSGCATCAAFWAALADPEQASLPGDVDIIIVTKDPSVESPSRLAELAPSSIPLVMSSTAWEAYAVEGSPYFVFVDAHATIAGEGTAQTWAQVKSLFRDFLFDIEMAQRYDFTQIGAAQSNGQAHVKRDDVVRDTAALQAAGVTRGHESLYTPFTREKSAQSSDQDAKSGCESC